MTGSVLSLDLATKTGWCVVSLDATPVPSPLDIAAGARPVQPMSGVVDLSQKIEGSVRVGRYYGRAYAAFRDWLEDMLRVHQPEYVVFEAGITYHKSQQAARMLLYLVGSVEEVAYRCGIDGRRCFEVNVVHIKKHAGVGGNANKAAMMRAGQERGWNFKDDNECDALWLADYALTLLGTHRSNLRGGRQNG